MAPTVIYECGKCGGLLMAAINLKTRTCPYCGATVSLLKSKRIAVARDAFEASEMLRKIKADRQSNVRKNKPK
jgi:DNA-directed RNA polymerase subunit RPC12/RpoP